MNKCKYCHGSGELWTECCNGASGCECGGREISLGQCRVCHGRGVLDEDVFVDSTANLDAVRAHIIGGYIGNPYGRSR